MTNEQEATAKHVKFYNGRKFKGLEFEEQAHVRSLIRQGYLILSEGVVKQPSTPV